MKTDGDIFASEAILAAAIADGSLDQVVNVAALPGIAGKSLAMADIHHGYGFCIGGVAAFPAEEGIVLPGGVGYDINCGVRLLATSIPVAELLAKRRKPGLRHSQAHPHRSDREEQLQPGSEAISTDHRERCRRDRPKLRRDRKRTWPSSSRAVSWSLAAPKSSPPGRFERGYSQVGSLGSGNHFIEIQAVEEDFRSGSGRLLRPRRGDGGDHDPHRLAGLRPPDRHRPYRNPAPQEPVPDQGQRPAAGLRRHRLPERAKLPAGAERRLQFRLGQPPPADGGSDRDFRKDFPLRRGKSWG